MMKKTLMLLSVLCLAIHSNAQNTAASAQGEVKAYQPLNDTVASVKDSLTFEQRVAMINRMKQKQDSKLLRFTAGITGGLCDSNEDSYMVEIIAAYYPFTYAGVSFGIEWNDNHGDKPLIEKYEEYEYDPNRIIQINLNPGLAFRTPTLWFNKTHSSGLMLHCDPGLALSLFRNESVTFDEAKDEHGVGHPVNFEDAIFGNVVSRTVKNHAGKWLFWRVKSAVTFRSGDVFLSLGWVASNYNIEYCRNNIRYTNGRRYNGIDKYKHTGTVFASITGQF